MRITGITRKSLITNLVKDSDRGFIQKAEKAYLRGDTYFKYKGGIYRVPQQYFVRMSDGNTIMDVPLEEFQKAVKKED